MARASPSVQDPLAVHAIPAHRARSGAPLLIEMWTVTARQGPPYPGAAMLTLSRSGTLILRRLAARLLGRLLQQREAS
jgi:hypothetical protein